MNRTLYKRVIIWILFLIFLILVYYKTPDHFVKKVYKVLHSQHRFYPLITEDEKIEQIDLVKIFVKLMEKHGLDKEYFFSGGTVLGSVRHHDMIPWDDDVDMTFNFKLKDKLLKVIADYDSYGDLSKLSYVSVYDRVKIFRKNVSPISYKVQEGLYWPNLDVTFYEIDSGILFDNLPAYATVFRYPVHTILPPVLRPFNNTFIPMPRQPYTYLYLTYSNLDYCSTNSYNHKFEYAYTFATSMPCSELTNLFAFNQQELFIENGQTFIKEIPSEDKKAKSFTTLFHDDAGILKYFIYSNN